MSLSIQVLDLNAASADEIRASTRRSVVPDPSIRAKAANIVSDVRTRGDVALAQYATQFGGGLPSGGIVVPPEMIEAAADSIDAEMSRALDSVIQNVRTCHDVQRPSRTTTSPVEGVTVERVWSPIERVGVYVPGGRAVYPSSLIMGVVPALIAGVPEICVATPARPDGSIDVVVLAVAAKLGVTQVYAMGGAQAIGALAYGTDTIARVCKIVGPGGPWVAAAKLAVCGDCGVDLPAGPSEAAIIADSSANSAFIAADLMCQAEHGEESAVILITTDRALVAAVQSEIEHQLPSLSRADVIAKALENEGRIVIAPDPASALAYANSWAPEHLSIHTVNAAVDAEAVPNAGSVFIGEWAPEAAGDYATGANHILPTGGLAAAYGPLGVEDFGSWRQIQTLTRAGLTALAPAITTLATVEGLTAHAHSVDVRLGAVR
jgi:histidinol dehydrogenase